MNFDPNEKQEEIIENTEGIYLVDAGPGTGKTSTITRRYIHLLEEDTEPEDILLITFTRNAADQMKEKIIDSSGYDQSKLREAPINTFHGHCKRILDEYGFEAPGYLGIDENITSTTNIIEDSVLETRKFERFMNQFVDRHPEYNNFYRIVYNRRNLLGLIKSLASKGIIPEKEGWYRNGEDYLDGSFEEFEEMAKELYEPEEGE
ncbi:MAG: UvrD-helicase domain-containing protein, partial [Candidatus Aenigmatarchaeota archaeon]